MANIRVDVGYTIKDGSEVSFTAPCDCTSTTGLKVYHQGGSKEFVFTDAHGHVLTGIGELFAAGAFVKVILDVANGYAYIQNADTNKYIEKTFLKKSGDTMTGALTTTALTISGASPTITFNETDAKNGSHIVNGNRHYFRSIASDTTYYEQFRTPVPSTGLTGNKSYDFLTTKVAKVLWTNASPTSAFAAQTITVNGLSDCSCIAILFTQAGAREFLCIQHKDVSNTLNTTVSAAYYASGAPYVTSRQVTTSFTNGTIKFGAGYQNDYTSTDRAIPVAVIGLY